MARRGCESADATPTIAQLQIPVFKQAAWVMASYEVDGDQPNVAQSVPMLIADAKQRLEEISFVTGNGTTAPAGAITRATVDGNAAVLTTASAPGVFSLLANLPVRFRTYPSANPFWAANIRSSTRCGRSPPFAAATASIVDDSTTPPKMFGYPFEESTTMDGVLTTGGHKGLILLDGNSYLIVDRIGTQMIYEPSSRDGRDHSRGDQWLVRMVADRRGRVDGDGAAGPLDHLSRSPAAASDAARGTAGGPSREIPDNRGEAPGQHSTGHRFTGDG